LGTVMTTHDVLIALGPGGTSELAERALAFLGQLELGGLAEVSDLLGKSPQSVGHWIAGRRHPTAPDGAPFPEPLVILAATPVWDLDAVRQWAKHVGIRPLGTSGRADG
jgi:hypothetical protein